MVVLGVPVPVGGCISLCLFAAVVALAVVVAAVAVMVGMYVPSHHRHWLKKLCKRVFHTWLTQDSKPQNVSVQPLLQEAKRNKQNGGQLHCQSRQLACLLYKSSAECYTTWS